MKKVRDEPGIFEGVCIRQCSDCETNPESCSEEMKRTCPFHRLQKKESGKGLEDC